MLNPGTIGGVGSAPATYIMMDLETMEIERLEISKNIERDASDNIADEYGQPAY